MLFGWSLVFCKKPPKNTLLLLVALAAVLARKSPEKKQLGLAFQKPRKNNPKQRLHLVRPKMAKTSPEKTMKNPENGQSITRKWPTNPQKCAKTMKTMGSAESSSFRRAAKLAVRSKSKTCARLSRVLQSEPCLLKNPCCCCCCLGVRPLVV